VLSGGVTGLTPSGIARAAVNGLSAAATFPSDFASMSPSRPVVARDLAARIHNAPAAAPVTIALVANPPGVFSDQPGTGQVELSCTVAPGDSACSAPGPVAVAPGSMLFMRIRYPGADPGNAYWGVALEPSASG
jgi:hypothetical protein